MSVPRSLSLSVAALLSAACAAPGPLPSEALPPVEFLGTVRAVEFRDREGPLDEPGPPPAALELADVLHRALLSSPELQAALARVRVAAAGARQERLLPNPVLSVTLRAVEGAGTPALDLGLAGDLHALLTRGVRADGAAARLRAAVAEASVVALDVAVEAASLAVEVRAHDDRLSLLAGKVEVLGLLLDASRERFASGEGRALDATVVEEEMAAAELDLLDARAAARAARLSLARRIGRPGDAAAWTVGSLPAEGPAAPEGEWIAAALAARPEIAALSMELQALEADARLAGLSPLEGMEAGVEVEGTEDWEAGPSFSIPLPFLDDGSERAATVLASMAEVRHRRLAAARLVVEEIRRERAALEAAAAARDLAAGRLLPLAEKRRAEAEAIHRSGESDLVDVLLAGNALQEARLRLHDADARAAAARVRLMRAAGGAAPASTPSGTSNGGFTHGDR